MRLLDRYIIKELFVPFAIGTFGVVLMFQANLLIAMMKDYSLSSVPLAAIFKLIIYKTPFFLSLTLPIGMALGASLALSRLTRESELTAMRSAGASIRRVMFPVFLFGAIVSVGQFYMVETFMPRAEKAATKLGAQVMILGGFPDFKSNVTVELRNYSANFGTVSRLQDGTARVTDVTLWEHPKAGTVHCLTAKTGTYRPGKLELLDVVFYIFKDDQLVQTKSPRTVIGEEISIDEMLVPPRPFEASIGELREEIRTRKAQGQDTVKAEVQYHIRYAVPASCAVFALAGPVFAIWLGRGGGFVGVLMSLLVVMLYYNVFIIATEILTRNAWMSPFVAAWFANGLFFVLALIGLRRLE